jgi:TrmH family RNA methyltransferase
VRAARDAGLRIVEEFVRVGEHPITDGTAHFIDQSTLERVASTVTPQPNIAVVEMPQLTEDLASLRRGDSWILVADRVADPGNLGTMVRSAVAAGASGVVTTSGSVDFYSPKVVRAAAGSLFAVPCVADVTLNDLATAGWDLVGTSSHSQPGVVAYDEADLVGSCAVVMGNEAAGIDPQAPVTRWVTIPHQGPVESLNVAMASTVLCFEVARQRKHRRQQGLGK